MAASKPLTRFLIALCHSSELLAEFNSDRRQSLLDEWGLAGHDLFKSDRLTLEHVQRAVAEEHKEEGIGVEVAWWIWFFGGPRPKPDWIWGVDCEDKDDDEHDGDAGDKYPGAGGGGPSNTQ